MWRKLVVMKYRPFPTKYILSVYFSTMLVHRMVNNRRSSYADKLKWDAGEKQLRFPLLVYRFRAMVEFFLAFFQLNDLQTGKRLLINLPKFCLVFFPRCFIHDDCSNNISILVSWCVLNCCLMIKPAKINSQKEKIYLHPFKSWKENDFFQKRKESLKLLITAIPIVQTNLWSQVRGSHEKKNINNKFCQSCFKLTLLWINPLRLNISECFPVFSPKLWSIWRKYKFLDLSPCGCYDPFFDRCTKLTQTCFVYRTYHGPPVA